MQLPIELVNSILSFRPAHPVANIIKIYNNEMKKSYIYYYCLTPEDVCEFGIDELSLYELMSHDINQQFTIISKVEETENYNINIYNANVIRDYKKIYRCYDFYGCSYNAIGDEF